MKHNTKKCWVNKEERAKLALNHTKEMEDLYKDEIEDCIDETLAYNVNSKFIEKRLNNKQVIIEDEIDSVGAIFKYININEITAVLNFASYNNPGGNFINGSKAQEECLCHESYLYNVLRKYARHFQNPYPKSADNPPRQKAPTPRLGGRLFASLVAF